MGQTSVALAMFLLNAVPLQNGNCRPTEYKGHPYPWGHAPHRDPTQRYCSKVKRKVAAWLRWIKEAVSYLVPLAKGKDFILAEVMQAVYFRETQTRTNKQKNGIVGGSLCRMYLCTKNGHKQKGRLGFSVTVGERKALKLKQHCQRCQVSNALTAFLKLWFLAYKKSFEKIKP